jgi:hypothetical protein
MILDHNGINPVCKSSDCSNKGIDFIDSGFVNHYWLRSSLNQNTTGCVFEHEKVPRLRRGE